MLDSKGPTGIWSGLAPAAQTGHRYKFEIVTAEGRTLRKADPMARQAELPPSDASVVPSGLRHGWQDDDWMTARGATLPRRLADAHLRGPPRLVAPRCRGLGLRSRAQLGDHVASLGFTHVELLPVAEHPFGGSWGYQVSGYYAPTARFGEPSGLARFVDAMHQRGIGVIVDWVPAHFPATSGASDVSTAHRCTSIPIRASGEHPEWGTYVFDFGRNQVRNFLVANALYLARRVPHRRLARRRRGLDAVSRLLPRCRGVGAQRVRRPREPRRDPLPAAR